MKNRLHIRRAKHKKNFLKSKLLQGKSLEDLEWIIILLFLGILASLITISVTQ